jgi:carbon monoxide dehydrogenase subunit G
VLSLDGEVTVRCSLEQAWDLFCRFDDVARLIPSVDDVRIDGDRILGRVSVKLGIVPVTSRIALEVVERKHLACLRAEGTSFLGETLVGQVKPSGVRGVEKDSVGHLRLHLDLRAGDSGEAVRIIYQAEVEAEGRLRKIYESILKTKAPQMMREFAENVRRTLEAVAVQAAQGAALPEPAPAPEVPPEPAAALVVAVAPARAPWWRRALAWLGRWFGT